MGGRKLTCCCFSIICAVILAIVLIVIVVAVVVAVLSCGNHHHHDHDHASKSPAKKPSGDDSCMCYLFDKNNNGKLVPLAEAGVRGSPRPGCASNNWENGNEVRSCGMTAGGLEAGKACNLSSTEEL